MKYPVVKQEWFESERGWGQRPDGYSLHLTSADRDAFVGDYWGSQPQTFPAPDIYSCPEHNDGKVIDVDKELYEEIKKSKNGIRRY
jgi:hypothetical protein